MREPRVSSSNPDEAQLLLALRATNLRVVELDEKSLELVQGGAGDWKPIPGKGRRGWYVDTATSSMLTPADSPSSRPRSLLHLAQDHPQRQALLKLVQQKGAVVRFPLCLSTKTTSTLTPCLLSRSRSTSGGTRASSRSCAATASSARAPKASTRTTRMVRCAGEGGEWN